MVRHGQTVIFCIPQVRLKRYKDLVANYKACGVTGDELRARLTQVEEELVEENERFQEAEHRLKKANEEIEVLTAFGPRQGEEGEEEEEEGGVSDDFIMAASVSGANKIPKFRAEGEDGNKAALWLSNLDAICLLCTSPSPRDLSTSRMPSSA